MSICGLDFGTSNTTPLLAFGITGTDSFLCAGQGNVKQTHFSRIMAICILRERELEHGKISD